MRAFLKIRAWRQEAARTRRQARGERRDHLVYALQNQHVQAIAPEPPIEHWPLRIENLSFVLRVPLIWALLVSSLSAAPPSSRAIDELAEDYLARREARGFDKHLSMPEALL